MAIQIENYSKIKGLNLIILMVALVVSMIILCVIYYNLDNIHIINSGPKFSSSNINVSIYLFNELLCIKYCYNRYHIKCLISFLFIDNFLININLKFVFL